MAAVSKKRERRRVARAENLPIAYYVHYLGDGLDRSPNLSSLQHTHVTNLYVFEPKMKTSKQKIDCVFIKTFFRKRTPAGHGGSHL